MSKENEYKELFISEALSNLEELNKLMAFFKKSPKDNRTIDAIFRITHTLKGNAAGMGFERITKFAHVLEDMFSMVKEGKIALDEDVFTVLFKSLDVLSELTTAINEPNKLVRYRGVQRKLEVMMEKSGRKEEAAPEKNKVDQDQEDLEEQKLTELNEEIHSASDEKAEDQKSELPVVQSQPEIIDLETEEEDSEHEEEAHKIVFSDLVQVPVKKLDDLLNLVGELIIERDRLIANTEQLQASRNEFSRLNRISSDLQYSVMDVRLVQVGFLFNKFHRVVRDAAKYENKEVDLIIEGSDTEIDRNILQIISDSLIHLIRNAIGHGLELPEEREQNQKKRKGQIKLSARNESEGVVIEISDDGKGLSIERIAQKAIEKGWIDESQLSRLSEDEIIAFIFQPGFSTSAQVNNISGRGVGMDVVKKALDSIGGNVKVVTKKGEGTTFSLSLPASMAVKGTLLFEISHTQYAVPLTYTDAVLSIEKSDIKSVQSRLMITHLGKTIQAIFLKDLFFDSKVSLQEIEAEKLNVIVVHYNGRALGLIVDRLLQQKEIVEKPLKKPIDFVRYISGVTIMGNGNVCLVINVPQIIQQLFHYSININKSSAVA